MLSSHKLLVLFNKKSGSQKGHMSMLFEAQVITAIKLYCRTPKCSNSNLSTFNSTLLYVTSSLRQFFRYQIAQLKSKSTRKYFREEIDRLQEVICISQLSCQLVCLLFTPRDHSCSKIKEKDGFIPDEKGLKCH